MARLARSIAAATLARCGVPLGADFHALASDTVAALLAAADCDRYRPPASANGSRARYYHARLQRAASPPARRTRRQKQG